ncbi:MAG: pre-toxin TG domain-containing protein [Bdellovibrio sp.]
MRTFISFLIAFIYVANSFAAEWPKNQTVPITVHSETSDGYTFTLDVNPDTNFELGAQYYFYDSEKSVWISAIFAGWDSDNKTHWSYLSPIRDQAPTENNVNQPPSPITGASGTFDGIHGQAVTSAFTTGAVHALYRGLIYTDNYLDKVNKLNEQISKNTQALESNFSQIEQGKRAIALQAAKDMTSIAESLKSVVTFSGDIATSEFASDDREIVAHLKELESILRFNRSTVPKRIEARTLGLRMIKNADAASAGGDDLSAQAFVKYAEAFADIALGLDPVTGPIRDTYEAFTGKNIVTNEDLDNWTRGFALLGAITFGFGSKIAKGIKVVARLEISLKIEKALGQAVKIDTHIVKTIEREGNPRSRATYEKYLSELRKSMAHPKIQDPKLRDTVEWYWRQESSVGNGSTAAAFRWERLTGGKVGGKDHSQKIHNALSFFMDWLKNNPKGTKDDIIAVENIVKDILAALSGN